MRGVDTSSSVFWCNTWQALGRLGIFVRMIAETAKKSAEPQTVIIDAT
jgi:hypothetical protein